MFKRKTYLYEKYFPKINSYVFHRVNDDAVRNEIVSNVFFKAMKKLSLFRFYDSHKSSFSSWLYRIAMNETNQYYRERKRDTTIGKKLQWNVVEGETIVLDYSYLKREMENLDLKQQNLITLRFFEKLSYKEIGEVLKQKEGTVKVRMHRLLNQMRKRIEEEIKR